MGRIGFLEIVVIAVAVMLLFGIKRLPEIGRALGKALKEFKKAGKEFKEELKDDEPEQSDPTQG